MIQMTKKKHVVIQAPPPKKNKMKEHGILPDPLNEMPLTSKEASKKQSPYKDAKTGKLKAGELSILDKVFKGLPIKLQENNED